MVRFIMSQEGHGIWNYIDDCICVSLPSKIEATFNRLQELLQELGLTVSDKKLVPPVLRLLAWVSLWIPWPFLYLYRLKNCQ